MKKKTSKTEKKALKRIGKVWQDLDYNGNVGIECENPLIGKNYLLTFHAFHDNDGYEKARTIAEFIVRKINEEDK